MAGIAAMWTWIGQNAISLIASVVAVCAASFTLYQALVQRRHNRLSTAPDLMFHADRHAQPLDLSGARFQMRYTARLINVGLGPAIVTKASLSMEGNAVAVNDRDALAAAFHSALNHPLLSLSSFQFSGRYGVQANGSIQLLDFTFIAASDAEARGVLSRLDRLHLIVSYRSVYGDTFTYDSKAL